MAKIELTPEDLQVLSECINEQKDVPSELITKLSPGFFEKLSVEGRFDFKALDKFKIPTIEYAGKRPESVILAQAAITGGAAPLQVVRSFANGKNGDWKNLIVQGDNLQFLKTCYMNQDPLIKDKIKGKIKLIYIDPPFATESDFQSSEGVRSYADKIDTAEFLENLRERFLFIRDLLSDKGSILVHLDQRMSHSIKILMDEIFGRENFRNEIILRRSTKSVQSQFDEISTLAVASYNLLFYTKSRNLRFPKLSTLLGATARGKWDTYWRSPDRPTMRYEIFGIKPDSGQWRWEKDRGYRAKLSYELFLEDGGTDEKLDEYYIQHFEETGEELDFVRLGPSNSVQYYVPPRDVKMSNSLWVDIPSSARTTGYPTEKSEVLLERCISWLTESDDLVVDIFAGSGTTAAVAEKLARRWVVCDFGKHAIYTMQKRILNIADSKKLGKSEKVGKYGQPPKLFCVVSAGAYDFTRIMDLRRNQDAYITFVLGLFNIVREKGDFSKKYKLPNIYAEKNGNPVEVFPVWDDEYLKNIRIDEEYLQGIIDASGGKLKGDYYIITPETCARIGNTTLKNAGKEKVNYKPESCVNDVFK